MNRYGSHPLCFSDDNQYDSWKKASIGTVGLTSGICSDCTPEYQSEMLKANRCSHPRIEFGLDEDGLVTGYFPNTKRLKQKLSAEMRQKTIPASEAPSLNVGMSWFPEFKEVKLIKKRTRHE